MKKMKVLFVAAEAAGFIKVGGLGDCWRLPCKLKESGADVCLVIPHTRKSMQPQRRFEFTVKMGNGEELCSEGSWMHR